jgi:hypothetical protein
MAGRYGVVRPAASGAAVGAGVGVVLVGTLGVILLARRPPAAGSSQVGAPATSAPATSTAPAIQQSTQSGVTTQEAPQATPLATAPPSASSGAPSVGNFQAQRLSNGDVVLTWTGTLQAVWNGADNEGYDLFVLQQGGSWAPLQAEVEPPLTVHGVAPGTTLGVAPVYVTSTGQIVAGAISSATV